MDKTFLLQQLGERLRALTQSAHRSYAEARTDASSGATRALNLANAQAVRQIQARGSLGALDAFHPRPIRRGEAIGLGALVEVEDGDTGKTLFLAPVGAGEELTGPDGDGVIQVVTPHSPFGRAVIGKRVGEVVEVTVHGECQEWTITYAA